MCICSEQHICNTLAFYHFTHYKSSHIYRKQNGTRKKKNEEKFRIHSIKKNPRMISDRVEDGMGQFREKATADTRLKFRIFRTMSNDNEDCSQSSINWHFCYSYRKKSLSNAPRSVLLPSAKGGKSLRNALFTFATRVL